MNRVQHLEQWSKEELVRHVVKLERVEVARPKDTLTDREKAIMQIAAGLAANSEFEAEPAEYGRIAVTIFNATPQPPAEPRERVLLMRSAEVGRWIQADGRSISGEYRYATLDSEEA